MSGLSFYSKRLGPKLRAIIDEQLEGSSETERLQLDSELVLMREHAGTAIELYSRAVEAGDAQAQIIAGGLMKEALKEVSDMALRASRIRAESKDSISPSQLNDVVAQICRFVYQVFGTQLDLILEFDRLITHTLRLPNTGTQGTMLTPDMDAALMDSTIPAEAELIGSE